MRIQAGGDGIEPWEIAIVISVEASRELMVDHGEMELVIPVVDTLDCLSSIELARKSASGGVGV